MSHPSKMKLMISVFALTAIAACSDKPERVENNAPAYSDSTTTSSSSTTTSATHDADNTARNERDRESSAMTADAQADGNRSDVEITRLIRAAIVEDDSLSTNAKNVKIITKAGLVNLRGPVANMAESQKIASIAQKFVGATKVKNELEVTKK